MGYLDELKINVFGLNSFSSGLRTGICLPISTESLFRLGFDRHCNFSESSRRIAREG